jgi:hypothetical protein
MRRFVKNSEVVARRIAGETILVPVTGKLADMRRLFSLNETAEFLWNLLERPLGVEDAAESLAREYGVERAQAADDAGALLGELHAAGLVSASE